MRDFDRFAEFLQREARGYNEPPETPGDAMWAGVEVRLRGAGGQAGDGDRPATGAGVLGAGLPGDGRPSVAPFDYNRPPPAPREEMWARIESAWALRRAAPVSRLRPAWLGQRGAAGWVAALAAAASLVLGIGLGRGTGPSATDEIAIPPPAPPPAVMSPQMPTSPVAVAESNARDTDAGEPIGTAAISGQVVAAAVHPGGEEAGHVLLAVSEPAEQPTYRTRTLEPDFDYATARHMGRAATLLTAFRTDRRTPASQEDLAEWARELLAETRMFLGLADSASPVEEELLQDLELVLIQIAGLGPGAPNFEWDLARESMERQGTLTRLRAVSAESET